MRPSQKTPSQQAPSRRAPALSRLEVEPLSDPRWARVERAVLQAVAGAESSAAPRAPRPPIEGPRWRPAAAIFVLAGALATIAGGLTWRAFVPSTPAGATRVETAAIGSRVEFGDSTIDVGPASAVRLAGDETRGVVVTLDRGRVECDVAPRRERPAYLVEAGGVEVRVVGTHFAVTRAGDAVAVDVQRGEVAVTSEGIESLIDAGGHWPSSVPAPSSAVMAATPPVVSSAPSSAPPSPSPATHEPGASHAVDGRPGATRPPSPPSPREQYEAASRLEAQQPEAAVAAYRDLSRQGGAWGENALFAAGRLQADRGNVDDARHLLRDYLGRYPGGPNAADARQLLDRLR
jgi:hypothetical protein